MKKKSQKFFSSQILRRQIHLLFFKCCRKFLKQGHLWWTFALEDPRELLAQRQAVRFMDSITPEGGKLS